MVSNPAWDKEDYQDGDVSPAMRPSLISQLKSGLQMDLQVQQGRLMLWVPVALGSGIAAYFGLPVEPALPVILVAGVVAIVLFYGAWRTASPGTVFLLGLFIAGLCIGKARTMYVATPVLAASSGSVILSGWVERVVSVSRKNPRIVVEVDKIEGLKRPYWPAHVQMTVFKTRQPPSAGDYIQISARLYMLPGPVAPGGYDHGRTLWFRGIGATGRGSLLTEVEAAKLEPRPAKWVWRRYVDDLRISISKRITAAMPKRTAGLALALTTGDRSLIPKKQREQMAIAGLAHVLAISGLHMSLVAGGVFWLIRALLALSPAIALNWPIKKWAAGSAILMGFGYLLVSGAGISTQRAYIMLVIMFAAVIADRPAISLRNLAIAAILILLISPEAVTTASFQMSFMAVMGLIAAYEVTGNWRAAHPKQSFARRKRWPLLRWVVAGLVALSFTTMIASLFTALPAAYHFNRAAPLSLISNILALPVVSVVVMPSAVLASLSMPFGLEAGPLWVMDKGLQYVIKVAGNVAQMDLSSFPVGQMNSWAVLMAAYGAIWLCLANGRIRALGLVPIVVGLVFSPLVERPFLLVERSAKNAAVRNAGRALAFAHPRRGRFAAERWLRADGDEATLNIAAKRPGWTCKNNLCEAAVGGKKLIYLMDDAKVAADCGSADIVVAQFPLRRKCRQAQLRIDRFDVWRSGAHAIYQRNSEIVTVTADQSRGERPWVVKPVARKEIRTDGGKPYKAKQSNSSTGTKKPTVSSQQSKSIPAPANQ